MSGGNRIYGEVVRAATAGSAFDGIELPLNDPCLAACCLRDIRNSKAAANLREKLRAADPVRRAIEARKEAATLLRNGRTRHLGCSKGACTHCSCCKPDEQEEEEDFDDFDDFDDDDDEAIKKFYESRMAEVNKIVLGSKEQVEATLATREEEYEEERCGWHCEKEGCNRRVPHEHVTSRRKYADSGYI